ncbi:MAG: GNAT family N-acetyltransferase [Clostridia bacterium]|nr:GNAT family N-acetyltransferase [Clostridia bacterium]
MEYIIREMNVDEYRLLDDFLYEAIFVPEGMESPPKDIIKTPELQVYVSDFGKKDDSALVALVDEKIIGAVWGRIMNDYGHIADDIPSLAIALYKEQRGHGIGTALMRQMLLLLKNKGYKKVSLSVQKANYAVKLYLKVGFMIEKQYAEEYIMVCDLTIKA